MQTVSLRAILPLLIFAQTALAATPQAKLPLIDIVFHYNASAIAALVFGIVYLILGLIHLAYCFRQKSWWCWCLPGGTIGSGIGLIIRMVFIDKKPDSKPVFTVSQILVICMPALFLAFNYMLYGRLLRLCVGIRHSLIRPNWITKVFVGCDISTFIIQGASTAYCSAADALAQDKDKHQLGRTLFKIGVILQSVTYYIFLGFVIWTHLSIKRERVANGKETWWKGLWTLYASSLFIVIRTIYRMIEALGSEDSPVKTYEGYFYGLDVVTLILCTIPYLFQWPTTYLGKETIATSDEYQLANRLHSTSSDPKEHATV